MHSRYFSIRQLAPYYFFAFSFHRSEKNSTFLSSLKDRKYISYRSPIETVLVYIYLWPRRILRARGS